jgi:methyl-accepting chemotaxis protein/anti-sigma regulatory factor (Ser/Thr protein kinase)
MDTRRSGSSIRTRIVRSTVAIVLVPLAVLGAVVLVSLQRLSSDAGSSVDESRTALSEQVVTANLEGTAHDVADDLDTYLLERVKDAQVWASDPLVRTASISATAEADRLGLTEETMEDLDARFLDDPSLATSPDAAEYLVAQIESSGAFAEVFFTDANGYNAAYSAKTSDFVQSDEDWYQGAWENGLDVGDIEYDDSAQTFSSDISVRIDGPDGERLGVLKAVLDLGVVQQIADDKSEDRNITILNEDGLILAETSTEHAEARVMNADVVYAEAIDPKIAEALQSLDASGSGSVITDEQAMGAALSGRTQTPIGDFAGFNWTVVVDQPTDVAFAPIASIGKVKRSIDDASESLTILVLVVLLLVAVAAFAVARSLALRIVRPILRLRDAADDVATTQLPQLVDSIDRLEPGEDLPALEPIAVTTGDEVEELADKFNSVISTATRLAAEQVESRRRNVSTAFVSMGRRNQSLIGRQLKVLDDLERNEQNADSLEGLFTLDQLATRMRRNAESLLVLAGQEPTRTWSKPMSMRDVVRSALSEIEAFARMEIEDIEPAYLPGNLVSEVAHLVAELCENAASFSPPTTKVRVVGSMREDGYRLAIIDRGIGMTDEQMADANEKLQNPAGFDRAPSQYLGHFVVGRLAARLGVEVRLFESAEPGLIARVTLPASLLETKVGTERVPTATAPGTDAASAVPVPPPAPADVAAAPVTAVLAPTRPKPHTNGSDSGAARPAPSVRSQLPPAPPVRVPAPPVAVPPRFPAPSAAPVAAPPVPVATAGPEPEPAKPATEVTASGFRVRERKAVAPAPAPATPAPVGAAPPTRTAAEARSTLSSFMTGVGQGRKAIDGAEPTDDPTGRTNDE